MSSAYIPYNGTASWSGTDTSRERAMTNLRTGKEYNNQQKALTLLKEIRQGLTWQELSYLTGMHHGTASGVLSVLHKSGAIVRSTQVRDKCKVYVHQDYKDNVNIEPYKKKEKPCPHCGLDINA
jgi:hypothetical protein